MRNYKGFRSIFGVESSQNVGTTLPVCLWNARKMAEEWTVLIGWKGRTRSIICKTPADWLKLPPRGPLYLCFDEILIWGWKYWPVEDEVQIRRFNLICVMAGKYGGSRRNSRLNLANKSSIMAIKRTINVSLIFNKQYYNIVDELK